MPNGHATQAVKWHSIEFMIHYECCVCVDGKCDGKKKKTVITLSH